MPLRSFSRTLLLGLPLAGLGWMLILRLFQPQWHWPIPAVTTALGVLLFAVVRLSPPAGRAIHRVWHGLRHFTELLLSTVALFLLYFLVITPAGLLRRTLSKSPVEFSHGRKTASFWKPAKHHTDPAAYLKQH